MFTAVLFLTLTLTFTVTLSGGHPCDTAAPNTNVCDPARGGHYFFYCRSDGTVFEFQCAANLVFNNKEGVCNWYAPGVNDCSSQQDASISTTTTTTTTRTAAPTTTTTRPTTTKKPGRNQTPTPTPPTQAPSTTKPTTTSTSTSTTTGLIACLGTQHPCDGALPDTRKCDPCRNGRVFYLCAADGRKYEYICPVNLVFDNTIQSCTFPPSDGTPACTAQASPVAGDTTASPQQTTSPARQTTVAPRQTTTPAAQTTTAPVQTTTKKPAETTTPLTTGPCNPATCVLPDCRCVGSDIPGGLPVSQVPQMVLLTFDDGIVTTNYQKYEQLLTVTNPNGCGTRATFFVSGDNTDMTMVKKIADKGHEIASHSVSHSQPAAWSPQKWDQEIEGMRVRLADGTGKNLSEIVGARAPYLSIGGDAQYSMMQDRGFLYDSTMYGGSYVENASPPLWPFTLQYPPAPSEAMCDQARCPQGSYPGLWEVPLIRQYTVNGVPCSMTDECNPASRANTRASIDDVVAFLRKNFQRHFSRNRAPFMISLHSTWFDNVPASLQGLQQFMRELSATPDVWQVSVTQMLDWVRNPKPVDRLHELPSWQC